MTTIKSIKGLVDGYYICKYGDRMYDCYTDEKEDKTEDYDYYKCNDYDNSKVNICDESGEEKTTYCKLGYRPSKSIPDSNNSVQNILDKYLTHDKGPEGYPTYIGLEFYYNDPNENERIGTGNSIDHKRGIHFDWWIFPIIRSFQKDRMSIYSVYKRDIKVLKANNMFMRRYHNSIRMFLDVCGYKEEDWVLNVSKGNGNWSYTRGKWKGYYIRLMKMMSSLYLFGEIVLLKVSFDFVREITQSTAFSIGDNSGFIKNHKPPSPYSPLALYHMGFINNKT
jgi:hypothetical protein